MLEFRLFFRGMLPSRSQGHAEARHLIRKAIHPQLRTLWQQHAVLSEFFKSSVSDSDDGMILYKLGTVPDGTVHHLGGRIDELATKFERFGFNFVPLLRRETHMACSLDVLLLRRAKANYRVFDGSGDIDNRIKSLIDGLTMPRQPADTGGQAPGEDENPFFCLLEDDKLVYDFSVATDTLLEPRIPTESEHDVVVVVKVTVKKPQGTFTPWDFY